MFDSVNARVRKGLTSHFTSTQPMKLTNNQKQSQCFANAYIQSAQFYQIPVLGHILSPSLESEHHLFVNTDRLMNDLEWQPIMKALSTARDLQHIYLFSNNVPQQSGCLVKDLEARHRFAKSKQSPTHFSLIRYMPNLMSRIKDIIINCPHLTKVELCGIPLRQNVLEILAKVSLL